MPPIVSIVGRSKSGKTTFIEKLIPELKSRGYQVATIKHAPQGITLDEPDKDSWRHIKAGSEATVIGSGDMVVLVKPVAADATLDEVARLLGDDYDIILTEGFKQGDAPKIEVHRQQIGPPLSGIKKLIAIVGDKPPETKVRWFSEQNIKGVADLVEAGFIKPQRERTSLYINGVPITLTTWPKQVIISVLLAMVSCLKGVGEVRRLELFLRKEPRQD